MTKSVSAKRNVKPSRPAYVLEEQIGFILHQVWQRHATIFAREIGINLTPTQWAALAKLSETGPCSQNRLGRLTAMDIATIKGVIDRLTARGLTETSADPGDGRRLLVSLTRAGQQLAGAGEADKQPAAIPGIGAGFGQAACGEPVDHALDGGDIHRGQPPKAILRAGSGFAKLGQRGPLRRRQVD